MTEKFKLRLDKTRTIVQGIVGLCFCIYFIKHEDILNWLANYANKEHLTYGIPAVCLALYFGLHIGKKFEWKDYSFLLIGLFLLYFNTNIVTMTDYICLSIIIIGMLISFIRS